MTQPETALERLLRHLNLEQLDRDLFLGDPGRGPGRLFGGLVAAQSLVAAARTVDQATIHSLHSYFLLGGKPGVPIRFVVDRIRDGRTFTTRRVVAHQQGQAIFSLEASFTLPEDGISHQEPMPRVDGPEGLPDWEQVRRDAPPPAREGPIEIRICDPDRQLSLEPQPPYRQVWIRTRGQLPEDPVLHAALMTFASDRGMLSIVERFHGMARNRHSTASLDHTIWFHRRPRWEGWMLYSTMSPAAHNARALILGKMHAQNGDLMASIAQEGLVRARREGV
jgi:acyl-CoA thioesterase-2